MARHAMVKGRCEVEASFDLGMMQDGEGLYGLFRHARQLLHRAGWPRCACGSWYVCISAHACK